MTTFAYYSTFYLFYGPSPNFDTLESYHAHVSKTYILKGYWRLNQNFNFYILKAPILDAWPIFSDENI